MTDVGARVELKCCRVEQQSSIPKDPSALPRAEKWLHVAQQAQGVQLHPLAAPAFGEQEIAGVKEVLPHVTLPFGLSQNPPRWNHIIFCKTGNLEPRSSLITPWQVRTKPHVWILGHFEKSQFYKLVYRVFGRKVPGSCQADPKGRAAYPAPLFVMTEAGVLVSHHVQNHRRRKTLLLSGYHCCP